LTTPDRATEGGAARLDKWLWRARFFRTRALAALAVEGGVRVNGRRIAKPGAAVRPGDVLTFVQAGRVRVVEVLDPGERRGPATEARTLYIDRESVNLSDT
jgi:ribosome-associated heat shock protein Hsp15